MTRLRKLPGKRTLLLLAAGAMMFLLWLGLWLRVLPDRPRVSFAVPEHTGVAGISNDGRWVVTRRVIPSGQKIEPTDNFIEAHLKRIPTIRGPIRVWDVQARSVVAEFLRKDEACETVRVSPDARFVLVSPHSFGSDDRRIFDAKNGRELGISPLPGEGWNVCFSPDGRFIAEVRNGAPGSVDTVCVWDLVEDRLRWEKSGHRGPLAFSSDGSRLAFIHDCEGSIDARLGALFAPATGLSPDVGEAGTAGTTSMDRASPQSPGPPRSSPADVAAVVFDLETGGQVRRFPFEDTHGAGSQFFSPELRLSSDGARLAVITNTVPSSVVVLDVHTGEELQRHGEVAHFAFLPDGSSFVRGWNDPQSPFKPDAMRHPTTSKGGRFLITQYWSSSEPENWLDRLKESLSGNPPTVAGRQYVYVSWDTCKLMPRGLALELSADEAIAACIGPTGHIEVWDLPPRRPIFPLLALAALPALLFTAVIWWRLGRG